MLLGLAGLVIDVVPLVAESVAFGAAAQTGYILAILLVGGTLAHRVVLPQAGVPPRALGGPDGWLDRHDLAHGAGEHGCAPPRRPAPPAPTGRSPTTRWQVGRLVSGGLRVRLVWWPRAWRPGRWLRNWRPRPRAVFSPWARGFGVVGPQGSGKTQFLVNVILDAPGAAVDAVDQPSWSCLTRRAARASRADRGVQPVAARVGRVGPALGPDLRVHRPGRRGPPGVGAGARQRGGGDRPRRLLGRQGPGDPALLPAAAALAGADMTRVMHWANDPDDPRPPRSSTRTATSPRTAGCPRC